MQSIAAADGGSFNAYVTTPPGGAKAPGILVLQEIFGVNPWLRAIADGFAAQGYIAMAPDMFWRIKPGVELSSTSPEQFQEATGYMRKFSEASGIADMKAAVAALRAHPGCTGKVASVGYCLGGKLAYLLACRADLDANVGYYPVNLPPALGQAGGITKPLMLHLPEEDKFVPASAQAEIKAALAPNPNVTVHSYPGADHAFARESSHGYHEPSAKLANERTSAFLRAALS
jgi:carboxymethylenebutenolidase